MSAGVDQAARLRELVRDQRGEPAGQFQPPTRIVVVTSGKGGVGKTNVTVNLALILAQRGRKVVLFDADLGMANVDVLLNLSPPFTIADVIAGRRQLAEIILPVTDNFGVVPGGSGIAQLASLERAVLDQTVAKLAELESRADFLLVDTGAGISPNVLGFVLAAPEVIVVTTPEPTAIVDAYGIIKAVDGKNQGAQVWLLINMVESESEARAVFSKLVSIIARFLAVRVRLLGWIEKDGNVGRSVLQQKPFVRAYPYSLATRRIHLLAGALLAQEADPAPKVAGAGFFARLGKALFR